MNKTDLLVGQWTPLRCPICGASIFVNALRTGWCTECSWHEVITRGGEVARCLGAVAPPAGVEDRLILSPLRADEDERIKNSYLSLAPRPEGLDVRVARDRYGTYVESVVRGVPDSHEVWCVKRRGAGYAFTPFPDGLPWSPLEEKNPLYIEEKSHE